MHYIERRERAGRQSDDSRTACRAQRQGMRHTIQPVDFRVAVVQPLHEDDGEARGCHQDGECGALFSGSGRPHCHACTCSLERASSGWYSGYRLTTPGVVEAVASGAEPFCTVSIAANVNVIERECNTASGITGQHYYMPGWKRRGRRSGEERLIQKLSLSG